MLKPTHFLSQKYLILPVAFLFGVTLLVSLSGMEIFSSLILLIVLIHIRWSEIRLKNFYRLDLLSLFALIFFCLLSLIINGHIEDVFYHFFKFRWILFLYLFALFLRLSPKTLPAFLTGFLVGLYISSLNSIFQFIANWDLVRWKPIQFNALSADHVVRVTSFFNLPTTYGYCLAMALFVPLVYLFSGESGKSKILVALIFLFGLASLVLTYTRGAWISFFCAFFCFVWLANKKLIVWLTPLFLLTGVLLFYFQPGFQKRVESLVNLNYTSNSERIELWKANWEIFKDHPLFGVGLHKNDKLVEDYNKILGHKHNAISHAHNTYLQFLAGTGLFGFISLMMFFICLLTRIGRKISHSRVINSATGTNHYNKETIAHLISKDSTEAISYEKSGLKLFFKNTGFQFHTPALWIAFLSILLSFLVGCLFDCNLRDAEVRYMLISLLSVFLFLLGESSFERKQGQGSKYL